MLKVEVVEWSLLCICNGLVSVESIDQDDEGAQDNRTFLLTPSKGNLGRPTEGEQLHSIDDFDHMLFVVHCCCWASDVGLVFLPGTTRREA